MPNLSDLKSSGPRTLQALLMACALLFASASFASAQQPAGKRPMRTTDFDSWRSILGQKLSRDGRLLAYALTPQEGDGEVVVRELATGREWRAPIGKRPEPPIPVPGQPIPEPQNEEGPAGPVPQLFFTADGRALAFQIFPARAEVERARKQKKKPEEMPKNALGIMDTATGEVSRVERVKKFWVPEDAGSYVAYLLEPKPEEKKPDATAATPAVTAAAAAPGSAAAAPAPSAKKEKKKDYGSDLVLRSLADKSERVFADVLDATFSKDGKSLVYTVSSKREETNGIYAATPGAADAPAALLSGAGKYLKPTWDERQTQLAFLSDRDDAAASQPKLKLYRWDRKGRAAREIVSTSTPNFRPSMVISEKGTVAFSLDGGRVFFGTAPAPEAEREDDAELPADERVVADLWHWKDDYAQPIQKMRSEREKGRTYRAVFDIAKARFTQLADEQLADVAVSEDGRWAVGSDDRAYRAMAEYDAAYADYYLIDATDGTRKPLLKKQRWGLSWSPGGRYLLFYDGKDWNSLSARDGRVVNLTQGLGVNFFDEDFDTPGTPFNYGNAGWTKDEKYVLLYDRFDVWQVQPDGGGAKNLTDGVGRREQTALRYVRLDPEERAVDPDKPMLLRAANEWTRDTGFYRDRVNGGPPEKLIMAAKAFAAPLKAKDADVLVVRASTFDEYPDLHVADTSFRNLRRVSDANPQKAQLLWGKAELVRFKSLDGNALSGVLMKPENFDPAKKYPMIVYIYERLSAGLHNFSDPRPGHSINPSYYVSNGYLVFMPDIVYTVGSPGQSALKCVLPGVQAVADKGFVNEQAVGIQGHSWGGYQIAYMVTQTNRFRAAAAGAVVSNMTSAYSGIRWGSGNPRQFQYERGQSRIGASLWESPMRYVENSPVFMADRVRTPLLLLHNDADDAVPWYQGIEYFLALRRLGREVYLFNYNNEFHGLRRRANQKDYARRMQQFFDHYLKGAPVPDWMEKGIPYLQREREKDKYRTRQEAGAGGGAAARP